MSKSQRADGSISRVSVYVNDVGGAVGADKFHLFSKQKKKMKVRENNMVLALHRPHFFSAPSLMQKSEYDKGGITVHKIFDGLPDVLTARDVSKVVGISISKCYDLFHSREFPSIRVGKRMTVARPLFEEWYRKQLDNKSC